jgi:nicotinate-nucleotide adenylyltransferase
MRIAFFGGTFDPPHRGHLAIARAAADRLRLDRVLFAPVGNQPLKHDLATASFEDRAAMVKLATAVDACFEFSAIDAPHPYNRPNYTLETILGLKESLNSEDKLFCLVGADSFLSLPRWYRGAELLVACDFIVAGRPGFDFHNTEKMLPPPVRVSGGPHYEPEFSSLHVADDAGRSATIYFLPDLREEISATEVRTALADHLTGNDALPQSVAEYIRAHHLYQ